MGKHIIFVKLKQFTRVFCLFIISILINSYKIYSQNDTSLKDMIIDPIPSHRSPYEVKKYNSHVSLPDSLGGNKYKGRAAIVGKINRENLQLEDIKIMLFILTQDDDTVIYYDVSMGKYPPNVQIYLPFLENIAKTVVIEKRKDILDEHENKWWQMLLQPKFNY